MRPIRLAGCRRAVKHIRNRPVPLISTTSIAGLQTRLIYTTGAGDRRTKFSGGSTFLPSNSLTQAYTTSSTKQQSRTMATATTIKVSTDSPGDYNVEARPDSAETASKVLQENLRKFHIYFNYQGFHSKNCLSSSPSHSKNMC